MHTSFFKQNNIYLPIVNETEKENYPRLVVSLDTIRNFGNVTIYDKEHLGCQFSFSNYIILYRDIYTELPRNRSTWNITRNRINVIRRENLRYLHV